jgi:hypothetical protein
MDLVGESPGSELAAAERDQVSAVLALQGSHGFGQVTRASLRRSSARRTVVGPSAC